MEAKPWYRSKTMWANGLAAAAMILAESQSWTFLPDGWEGYSVAALGVVNILLRSVTRQPVKVRN